MRASLPELPYTMSSPVCLFPFGSLSLQEIRQLGRLFAIVEKLVHWDFEDASELLKCLDGGDDMSVSHTRYVIMEQTCILPTSYRHDTL
jgi:hypothetical protein